MGWRARPRAACSELFVCPVLWPRRHGHGRPYAGLAWAGAGPEQGQEAVCVEKGWWPEQGFVGNRKSHRLSQRAESGQDWALAAG